MNHNTLFRGSAPSASRGATLTHATLTHATLTHATLKGSALPASPPMMNVLRRAALGLSFLSFAALTGCGGNVVVDDPNTTPTGTTTTNPEYCEPNLSLCNGFCVDLDYDASNCGSCGQQCFGGYCDLGNCITEQQCPDFLSNCFGECVDTLNDSQNCGSCGNVCSPNSYCFDGECYQQECLCGELCNVTDLGSTVPQNILLSTNGLQDSTYAFCAYSSGVDAVFFFTPPQSGVYYFDTFGSTMTTALEVRDTGCSPYACSTDEGGGGGALGLDLGAGQTVIVIVDALGASGTIALNIYSDEVGNCAGCADFISGGSSAPLCPGSENLYNDLVTCICEEVCSMVCVGLCSGMNIDQQCQDCVVDTQKGCGNQFNDCANDF